MADFSTMTKRELLEVCRKEGLSGYSKFGVEDLRKFVTKQVKKPKTTVDQDLASKTLAQLKTLAKKHSISLDGAKTKEQIVARLRLQQWKIERNETQEQPKKSKVARSKTTRSPKSRPPKATPPRAKTPAESGFVPAIYEYAMSAGSLGGWINVIDRAAVDLINHLITTWLYRVRSSGFRGYEEMIAAIEKTFPDPFLKSRVLQAIEWATRSAYETPNFVKESMFQPGFTAYEALAIKSTIAFLIKAIIEDAAHIVVMQDLKSGITEKVVLAATGPRSGFGNLFHPERSLVVSGHRSVRTIGHQLIATQAAFDDMPAETKRKYKEFGAMLQSPSAEVLTLELR